MTDYEFFDTNVVYYAKLDKDLSKQKIASKLLDDSIKNHRAYISVQVIEEFINNAEKKAKKGIDDISPTVNELIDTSKVVSLTPELAKDAIRISKRYQFSIWDSFIAAAALYAECSTLYTEDLQDGQVIDGVLTVHNPFVAS
jgi:predicted nucleic acid-binding protein